VAEPYATVANIRQPKSDAQSTASSLADHAPLNQVRLDVAAEAVEQDDGLAEQPNAQTR